MVDTGDIEDYLKYILKLQKSDEFKYSDSELRENVLFEFDDLKDEDIEKLIIIKDNAVVVFYNLFDDEFDYINNLIRIFKIMQQHNRTYNIKIKITNRELLLQSGLLEFSNVNLIINTDDFDYSKEQFLSEEKMLDELVVGIKDSDLSPYEKFLAVFNKVKQFKNYKENKEKTSESRHLRYILINDYIVCYGFANLFTTLLNKVGIPSMSIDVAYDDGFSQEDKSTKIVGHERNLVLINDDKYNIHGVYVSDATWDNDKEFDYYNNSAMTFNRKKEAFSMETLRYSDLLLDFHNFGDFCEKINFFLRRKINENNYALVNDDKIVEAFESLYKKILFFLYHLDYKKYKELYDRYNELVEKYINDYKTGKISLEDVKNIFDKFLAEYANYIIPLSNKEISKETMLAAISSVKRKLSDKDELEIQEEVGQISSLFDERGNEKFPYVYDSNMDASMVSSVNYEKRNKYEYHPKDFGVDLSFDDSVTMRFNYLESREESGHSR